MGTSLFQKNYVINEYLLRIKSELQLDFVEFLILMYFVNDESKKLDVENLSLRLFVSKDDILNAINLLIEKGVITLNSKKDKSGKMADYIKLDGLLNIIKDEEKKESNQEKKQDIYWVFEKEFGRTISSMEYEIINAWMEKDFSEEIIVAALKEAVYNGVTNLRYIDKILYEWKKRGINTPKDVEEFLKKRKGSSKKNEELFDYNWLEDETD